jgi:spoIIIJ-associated protein
MAQNASEVIQSIVTELIAHMGFSATVTVSPLGEGHETGYLCSVTVAEGQNFLIGQYGMNLAALQHLTRVLARKKLEEKLEIIVDINNYFAEKRLLLEKEAAQALEEALQNNISVALRPMLPYERKIVHAFLAAKNSVITESVGVGEDRKVMVRPKPVAGE